MSGTIRETNSDYSAPVPMLYSGDVLDADEFIRRYQGAVDKVCAVYGMSKSLLGMEDIDKYATFEGRMRIYWLQQLVPLLHGIERAFDRYFAGDLIRQAIAATSASTSAA